MVLLDREGASIHDRIQRLDQADGPRQVADYCEESDLRSGLLALGYRVDRLIGLYRATADLFEQTHPEQTTLRGNVHRTPIYYEVDAFLTAGRGWYETLRRLVWKHYGKSDRPQSFSKMLNCAGVLPPDYLTTLRDSWTQHGSRLTEYRDCLMHYDPLDDGGKTAWLNRWNGNWGVTVTLPSNAASRSRRDFGFATGPDVLSYAHTLLCHFLEVAEATDQLPAVAAHRAKPYPG
jgi:hypothetical protein